MTSYYQTDLINITVPSFKNANCLSIGDPELFFYNSKEKGAAQQIRAAKKVCSNCVHKLQCLDFALDNEIKQGIWGGLSEYERKRILRMRAAKAS